MEDEIHTTAEFEERAVLPQVREVHTAPGQSEIEVPRALTEAARGKSAARWAYERLIVYIRNFEKGLDAEQEVAMGFTGGDAGIIRIEGLGYFDPDIVTFYGSDPSGARTQVVQHVAQLNVLLRALPKKVDRPEAVRIGFRLARELEEGAATE
ncbi:DUF6173 family protein [Histidinibacterium aquaticum]|uniref:Uncharacterized protein n=1 Tax=Histidinibacterium aquaticum TaxID=2613962 RepID=A0A5J5GTD5_9RHOB|nr:DUF6173 family protein [Histidinibacterium aquaticum]KAA9010744.1 hypothetical protein F3S47_04795 [Histidinibacterium aquaticum]